MTGGEGLAGFILGICTVVIDVVLWCALMFCFIYLLVFYVINLVGWFVYLSQPVEVVCCGGVISGHGGGAD